MMVLRCNSAWRSTAWTVVVCIGHDEGRCDTTHLEEQRGYALTPPGRQNRQAMDGDAECAEGGSDICYNDVAVAKNEANDGIATGCGGMYLIGTGYVLGENFALQRRNSVEYRLAMRCTAPRYNVVLRNVELYC